MGVRILEGRLDGGRGPEAAVLYDSVTDWAFGPIFENEYDAKNFLMFLSHRDGRDARVLKDSELEKIARDFVSWSRNENTGEMLDYDALEAKKKDLSPRYG